MHFVPYKLLLLYYLIGLQNFVSTTQIDISSEFNKLFVKSIRHSEVKLIT